MLPNLTQLSSLPTGNVLIIDHEENDRILLRDTLELQGHIVAEAKDAHDGLRLMERNVPDVVVCDAMMPQMDGYDVCRRIKENPASAHLPVLLITTLTERKERLEGIQAGANDFICKPIDVADVTLRVRNAVQTKKLFDSLQVLQQKIVQVIVRDTRAPLAQALELLQPLRKRGSKAAKPLDKACKILTDIARRFDQFVAKPSAPPSAKAA